YVFRSRVTDMVRERRAETILHEMAHMWFGDLVTMRWWDDLWLNESFAEWAAHHSAVRATKYVESWTGFTNNRKNWAYRQDQLPTSHPIAADNPDLLAVEVNFDGITYAKGASALKQLVAWVGEEEFVAGLRAYFKEHAFGNSEFADLLRALEATSGRDLHAWAQEWLQTCGPNTLSPRFELDSDGSYTSFAVHQAADPDTPTLRRHRIGIGLYDRDADGRLVRRTSLETDVQGELTDVPKLVGIRQPDLLLLNDGDLTYAKIRLDERSKETVLTSIASVDDSLSRDLCWGACWDMTRGAEMAASDFVDLVLQGLGQESDETAAKQLPIYVQIAIDQYTVPAKRAELRQRWEDGLRALIEAATPGSDHQLTFLKCFCGTLGKRIPPSSYGGAARSDTAMAWLRQLLDGTATLEGLRLGQDLRWVVLTTLSARGHADRDVLLAELARDKTISGQERAAAALAVMPDPAAKAESWEIATMRRGVANETQRCIAYTFDTSDQAEVLAPYLEKYLERADTIWDERGLQIASTTLEYMFPRSLTSAETLERVDRWLATSPANPGAKRYVREGRADIERALAAQERFA
ncbi:MAG: aminopeptidase N, partial [Nocardioidaceae bacterium]